MRDRDQLWVDFINEHRIETMLELGVWRGEFSELILRNCPSVRRYYMLDPWRHLSHWEKPLNVDQTAFEVAHSEALRRTDPYKDRRIELRGTTVEVIDQIPDASLDLAYIDGDHTLRGITIDLIRSYPKVTATGFIGGDDLQPSIWQHGPGFEPTMVFPAAVYFAEAMGHRIEAIGADQFMIRKATSAFEFAGHNQYPATSIRTQARPPATPSIPARLIRRLRNG